jgi:WD40 repeat protein/serine/threonine protein kinase/tetratricopeptide (TPR) repeat protein
MTASSDARNPVELLAEEFLDRKRRGEEPTLGEYLERYPDLAGEIRDLFPALLMVEDLGASPGGTTGSVVAAASFVVETRPQRLGDYRILREIGRGGMGVVYEAEQESLGRRVALKVLAAGALSDPQKVRRFEREARAAARLHHTNIVPVFGVGHHDGQHYYVMQFIAGLGLDRVLEDLRRLRKAKDSSTHDPDNQACSPPAQGRSGLTAAEVSRSLLAGQFAASGPIPVGETITDPVAAPEDGSRGESSSVPPSASSELSALSDSDRRYYRSIARIGIHVAEALEYANRQGILHRDIKPSNLLLDNRHNVWVADFGLAKTAEADDLTHTGDILGTIRYMAPERFQGKCDARSDVNSLGLTLYELVAFQPAFEAADRHPLIERVLQEEPVRLRKLAPGVPRDLETIIAKASAREPSDRYATAAALAEDLKRFVEDRPIAARWVSPAERFRRWCRRNPWLAAATGVAAAALLAVAALSLLYAKRQARHADEMAGANEEIRTALAGSKRRVAILDFERGQAAFEKGHVGEGMLWTVESLRMATESGAEDWTRVALANLAAWRPHLVELKGLLSHGDQVRSVAFSRDGKTILTGSFDQTARLWDAETGRPIGEPLVNPERVFCAAFSPDGKTILAGCGDGTARLWDAATGRPSGRPLKHMNVGSAPLGDIVSSVAFSPDGRTILTGGWDHAARLWDAATGRVIDPPLPHPSRVESVAFSPDGRTILTGCTDGAARLWNAATGQLLVPPLVHVEGNTPPGFSAAFSPDGRTILTGGWDKTARLWDAHTGRPIGQALGHSDVVTSVAYSPDGQTILTGCSDGSAQLWDAVTGHRVGRSLDHQGEVLAVAYGPDGRSILTGCSDGTARLWQGEGGEPIHRPIDYRTRMGRVVFGADGETILIAGPGQVQLRETVSGRILGRPVDYAPEIFPMALSPDGRIILTGGPEARLWNAHTGRALGPPLAHPDSVSSVEFSPNSRTILTGCRDGTVRLWDAATGQQLAQIPVHLKEVASVVFSPDGKTILAGSFPAARLLDAATGRPIGPPLPHRDRVDGVAFSPDGKVALTGSFDKSARLWNARTGEPMGPPLMHQRPVWSVAFSPDGRWILTGAVGDASQLWDAATFQPIGPRLREEVGMWKVAFSRDGRFLLTGHWGSMWRWDAPAPLPVDVPRLYAWVEAATGLELDERGAIRPLDQSAWLERRRRLEQFGGPPPADSVPRLDPIVYGPEPAARGDAWRERGQWDRAETAYNEALRARPLNATVRDALVRLHIERGHLDRAVVTLAEAVRLIPDDDHLHQYLALVSLEAGDRAGWRRSTAAALDRFAGTINPFMAHSVARASATGPEATADPEVPIRLAEISVRGLDASNKPIALNTLAAAQYRAGRYDEAIRRLEEAAQARGGASRPEDWAFQAMAHHRLGHPDEARRWLERLRERQPSTASDQFWFELEIRVLRREAEAVVLYDPAFPADPFAP